VQPVNVSSFLGDPRVRDIINKDRDDKGSIRLGTDRDPDRKPILRFPTGYNYDLANDIVTVPLSLAALPITITVTNANIYSNIEWYMNGTPLVPESIPPYTNSYTKAITIDFTNTPLWYIIVIGTIETDPGDPGSPSYYSTHFSVRVN
jgi:hypothetical protein